MENNEKQLASKEQEREAAGVFPYRKQSAEEYAAREAHNLLPGFSADQFLYQDRQLEEWINKLGMILKSPELIAKYRLQCLTLAEREAIQKKIA